MGRIVCRARTARWLVRWASRSIDASYVAYVRRDKGEVPDWYDELWAWRSRRINRFALPLASRLDRDATGAEMAECGWWG